MRGGLMYLTAVIDWASLASQVSITLAADAACPTAWVDFS
jgi:hypothetical protein